MALCAISVLEKRKDAERPGYRPHAERMDEERREVWKGEREPSRRSAVPGCYYFVSVNSSMTSPSTFLAVTRKVSASTFTSQ